MRNMLSALKILVVNVPATAISPLYQSLREAARLLAVDANVFSTKRKRPAGTRHMQYTRDVLRGENVEVGAYTYGRPDVCGQLVHPEVRLRIGKFCSFARGVTIYLGMNHRTDLVSTYPFKAFPDDWPQSESLKVEDVGAVSKGNVVIGNDVWIGDGARILSGVSIGDGAVIGAGAVVTQDVEPYSIVAGNPARPIGKRFDEQTVRKLLEIRWWDWPVEKINRNLNVICSNNVSELFRVA